MVGTIRSAHAACIRSPTSRTLHPHRNLALLPRAAENAKLHVETRHPPRGSRGRVRRRDPIRTRHPCLDRVWGSGCPARGGHRAGARGQGAGRSLDRAGGRGRGGVGGGLRRPGRGGARARHRLHDVPGGLGLEAVHRHGGHAAGRGRPAGPGRARADMAPRLRAGQPVGHAHHAAPPHGPPVGPCSRTARRPLLRRRRDQPGRHGGEPGRHPARLRSRHPDEVLERRHRRGGSRARGPAGRALRPVPSARGAGAAGDARELVHCRSGHRGQPCPRVDVGLRPRALRRADLRAGDVAGGEPCTRRCSIWRAS